MPLPLTLCISFAKLLARFQASRYSNLSMVLIESSVRLDLRLETSDSPSPLLTPRTNPAGGRERIARCCALLESCRDPNRPRPTHPYHEVLPQACDPADRKSNSARKTLQCPKSVHGLRD